MFMGQCLGLLGRCGLLFRLPRPLSLDIPVATAVIELEEAHGPTQ